tara:strand:+ start:933 stop:1220 length:288 start_codon:yes stop_codon:yes gene_type:complete
MSEKINFKFGSKSFEGIWYGEDRLLPNGTITYKVRVEDPHKDFYRTVRGEILSGYKEETGNDLSSAWGAEKEPFRWVHESFITSYSWQLDEEPDV